MTSKPTLFITGGQLLDHIQLYDYLDNFCFQRNYIIGHPDGNWLPDVIVVAERGSPVIDWAVVNWLEFHEYPQPSVVLALPITDQACEYIEVHNPKEPDNGN